MKDNFWQEIIISLIIIAFLIFFLNPFNFLMPTALLMTMVLGLAVVFALFASFIWREKGRDEREDFHKMFAGRFAFIAGMGTLVLGIIIQSFKHNLDIWLILTLGAMILAKIAGLIYSRFKH